MPASAYNLTGGKLVTKPRERITGVHRERFAAAVAEQYASGMTIREIAAYHSRSYTNVRSLLIEVGAPLRKRGQR